MKIYGAGMSGLLAAHMLRRFNPVVHEAAAELPNNHAALLRFRSDVVSKATGIPFKKVWVQKCVMENNRLVQQASISSQNLYGWKVSGKIHGRSIMNLTAGERYIAPEDFISQLAQGLNIEYSSPLLELKKGEPFISTIPMPKLMEIAGWKNEATFGFKTITTLNADIDEPDCDVYQTIYYPDPRFKAYRASITGRKLIIEFPVEQGAKFAYGMNNDETSMEEAKIYLGHFFPEQAKLKNVRVNTQYYGKLLSHDDAPRKEFILAMTDLYNCYSLGRFGTWRQILMDDVVKDVKIVESMIENRDAYSRRLHIV